MGPIWMWGLGHALVGPLLYSPLLEKYLNVNFNTVLQLLDGSVSFIIYMKGDTGYVTDAMCV